MAGRPRWCRRPPDGRCCAPLPGLSGSPATVVERLTQTLDDRAVLWGTTWFVLIPAVAGGLVGGAVLGSAQAWALGRLPALRRRRYELVTVLVAGLGWAAASLPAALTPDGDGPTPPLPWLVLGAAGLGLGMGRRQRGGLAARDSLIGLEVHGSRTDRTYRFPVQYAADHDGLVVVPARAVRKTWWTNLTALGTHSGIPDAWGLLSRIACTCRY